MSMLLHARCRCIAAALAEVGLDPARMMCNNDPNNDTTCCVGFGTGTEGRPLAEVEALCDKAIEICAAAGGHDG